MKERSPRKFIVGIIMTILDESLGWLTMAIAVLILSPMLILAWALGCLNDGLDAQNAISLKERDCSWYLP
jgi:hypothetical protein